MRKLGLLLLALTFLMLTDVGTFAQRAQFPQQPQRSRQRSTQFNRSNRGNFEFRAKEFPTEYSVLLKRTLFAREHTIASSTPPSRTSSTSRRTEYIFRGAILENGARCLAGIENRSSNRMLFYAEGGSVAGPNVRITEVSLDHIVVSDRNGRRLITIGESLDAGKAIANPPTTLPAIANGPRPSDDQ